MPNYLYNKNRTDVGFHEIHTTDCAHKPERIYQTALGSYVTCTDAINKAKSLTGDEDFYGCAYCCPECRKK